MNLLNCKTMKKMKGPRENKKIFFFFIFLSFTITQVFGMGDKESLLEIKCKTNLNQSLSFTIDRNTKSGSLRFHSQNNVVMYIIKIDRIVGESFSGTAKLKDTSHESLYKKNIAFSYDGIRIKLLKENYLDCQKNI